MILQAGFKLFKKTTKLMLLKILTWSEVVISVSVLDVYILDVYILAGLRNEIRFVF